MCSIGNFNYKIFFILNAPFFSFFFLQLMADSNWIREVQRKFKGCSRGTTQSFEDKIQQELGWFAQERQQVIEYVNTHSSLFKSFKFSG